ncbi:uncharacterized protein BKA78DRAFT_161625 [Phyllosticta capitalensis]|uniref:uncharacterized protein n=1 Tax=Phyllosticta capitalensis TaxID=121624 RepID=UPI00313111BA
MPTSGWWQYEGDGVMRRSGLALPPSSLSMRGRAWQRDALTAITHSTNSSSPSSPAPPPSALFNPPPCFSRSQPQSLPSIHPSTTPVVNLAWPSTFVRRRETTFASPVAAILCRPMILRIRNAHQQQHHHALNLTRQSQSRTSTAPDASCS